jgi:1-acyl-sn-glycerol-3-phosphate acyltransferase
LIPVAVVGAYEVMPKGTPFPKPRPIVVVVGPHMEAELVSQLTDDELLVELEKRLRACDQRGRELVGLA